MLKMSFYNKTLNRTRLMEFIGNTNKPIVYTYGYESKHPTTHRVPKTKAEALSIIAEESLLDATEEETCIHLNAFSSNDMW